MKKPSTTLQSRAARGPKHGSSTPPRKALGQHYLVDGGVLEQILTAAELGPEDVVVEVGPGQGALTRHLVEKARRVIAIEIDPHPAAALPARTERPPNLTVINADARDVDLDLVLEGDPAYKLVANLPYYAATPILRHFLEAGDRRPVLAVIMAQKEVAQSMAAEGGKMSLLATAIHLYGVPRIVCSVPPKAFYPPPKVTSAVVRIDVRARPAIDVGDPGEFFEIVRAGFFAPRKQLRNSLSLGLGITTQRSSDLLELADMDPKRRAENLSLKDWERLCKAAREKMELWKLEPTPR